MQIYLTALEAKVVAVNHCHFMANEWYPRLKTFFEPFVGQKIFTNTGFTVKVKNALSELGLPTQHNSSVIWSPNNYSLVFNLSVTAHYRARNWTPEQQNCHPETCRESLYIGNLDGHVLKNLDYNYDHRRSDYSIQEIDGLRKEYKDAKAKADDLLSQLRCFGEYDRN